jgi:type IV pilus assembly protein PilW
MTFTQQKHQNGFSVVEVMIAMLLSMALAGGIISVFVNNSYSFKQDENIGRMQDNARFALREIAFDISMAGHYADLHIPDSVSYDGDLAIATPCGPAGQDNWIYRTTEAGNSLSIMAVDNATNAAASAAHSCFDGSEILDGTDVVAIKRVAGAETTPAFRPSIYYIRQFADTPGDDIPTLCRKALSGAGPVMTTECLATGIENLQIEYGIDTSQDGHPNVYLTNPTLTQMQDVVAARIFLIARTTDIDTRYVNNKTYSISNAPDVIPGDSFHRRVFSTSVMKMMGF